MPSLTDARSLRSQRIMQSALMKLMGEAPFEQITLRDIQSTAGVSAPTFYRHYSTKEDLLADIARQEAVSFITLQPSPIEGGGASPGAQISAFIASRRSLWTRLLAPGVVAIMREEFIRCGQEIANNGPRFNPRFPASLTTRVFAGGLFEIIAWWFEQPEDFPRSEVAEMLETLVIYPVIKRDQG